MAKPNGFGVCVVSPRLCSPANISSAPVAFARVTGTLCFWRTASIGSATGYVNNEDPVPSLPGLSPSEALSIFEAQAETRGLAETTDLLGMAFTLGGDLIQASESYRRAIELAGILGSGGARRRDRPSVDSGLAEDLSRLLLVRFDQLERPRPARRAAGLGRRPPRLPPPARQRRGLPRGRARRRACATRSSTTSSCRTDTVAATPSGTPCSPRPSTTTSCRASGCAPTSGMPRRSPPTRALGTWADLARHASGGRAARRWP